MPRRFAALALLALLALPAFPQTLGTATIRRGCSVPAPPGSLVAAPAQPLVYVPDAKGKIHIEFESLAPFGGWRRESSLTGYRGSGYFHWVGANHFNQPGIDTLTFRFDIRCAGNHIIRLRNQHNNPDPSASNDCWMRLDGGPWEKWVDNWGTGGINVWSFNAFLESTGAFLQPNLSQGVHRLEISGRSNGFKLDSLHILPRSVWFANTTDPASKLLGMRPVIGQAFTALVDDPTNSAGLIPGATAVRWFADLAPASGFPCGTVLPAGEALISLSAGLRGTGARTWMGPGKPVVFSSVFPNDTSLVGLKLWTQALFFHPGQAVLTDALDLLIGDV